MGLGFCLGIIFRISRGDRLFSPKFLITKGKVTNLKIPGGWDSEKSTTTVWILSGIAQ